MSAVATNTPAVVVAALPREIAALVRGHEAIETWKRDGVNGFWLGNGKTLVVAAGMGARRATKAVEAALAEVATTHTLFADDAVLRPMMLLSVGLAGACSDAVRPGEVAIAREVVDTLTGERFATADANAAHVLATSAEIASVREKQRLHAAYGAAMVDMEAATVARLARAHDIPFRAIKAISDAQDFELESLNRFADARGQFRTVAFALHTALRPWRWAKAAELGRHSARALEALTRVLREELGG